MKLIERFKKDPETSSHNENQTGKISEDIVELTEENLEDVSGGAFQKIEPPKR